VPKNLIMDNLYIENDKTNAPFLLAASFSGLIKFVGTQKQGSVLYWQFSPNDKAEELVSQLQTKTEPHIPARDLFEAISTFWKQIQLLRNGEIKNGAIKN
jgi:hypothetical protein